MAICCAATGLFGQADSRAEAASRPVRASFVLVVDPAGRPLPGARVWAVDPDVRRLPRGSSAGDATTEVFQTDVPPGTWRVSGGADWRRFAYRYPFLATAREFRSYLGPAVVVAAGRTAVVVLD